MQNPGNFGVQLKVDNSKSGPSTSVGGIPPRSEKSSAFSDVKLSRGNHTLVVSLDPNNQVTEGNEGIQHVREGQLHGRQLATVGAFSGRRGADSGLRDS